MLRVAKDYLKDQKVAMWGKSFDLLNNLDSAAAFVVDLVTELDAYHTKHEQYYETH